MKLDKNYSSVLACPEAKKQMSDYEYRYSNGVCPRCGNIQNSTFVHATRIVGQWERPSVWEWVCGKRAVFHPKQESK